MQEYLKNIYGNLLSGNINVFSIGYIGFYNLEKNLGIINFALLNENIKLKSNLSFVCFIFIIISCVYGFFAVPLGILFCEGKRKKFLFIILTILLFFLLVFALNEFDTFIKPEGKFPSFYFEGVDKISNNEKAYAHFWGFLPFFLITFFYVIHLYCVPKSDIQNLSNLLINPLEGENLNGNYYVGTTSEQTNNNEKNKSNQ